MLKRRLPCALRSSVRVGGSQATGSLVARTDPRHSRSPRQPRPAAEVRSGTAAYDRSPRRAIQPPPKFREACADQRHLGRSVTPSRKTDDPRLRSIVVVSPRGDERVYPSPTSTSCAARRGRRRGHLEARSPIRIGGADGEASSGLAIGRDSSLLAAKGPVIVCKRQPGEGISKRRRRSAAEAARNRGTGRCRSVRIPGRRVVERLGRLSRCCGWVERHRVVGRVGVAGGGGCRSCAPGVVQRGIDTVAHSC